MMAQQAEYERRLAEVERMQNRRAILDVEDRVAQEVDGGDLGGGRQNVANPEEHGAAHHDGDRQVAEEHGGDREEHGGDPEHGGGNGGPLLIKNGGVGDGDEHHGLRTVHFLNN